MWEYLDNSGNSTCSPVLEVEFWDHFSSDTEPCAPSKTSLTEGKSCCNGSATESCLGSQSGTTCGPSTENRGVGGSMSSLVDFHARESQLPGKDSDSTTREAVYGQSSAESFAKWDQNLPGWRTLQCLLLGGWELYYQTWPDSGLMRSGECFRLENLGRGTAGPAYGFWLSTPCKTESKDRGNADVLAGCDRGGRLARNICARHWKDRQPIKVQINPCFLELSMGWPIGWTGLNPLATGRFQQWLRSHGAL